MSLDELARAKKFVVGTKQTNKAVENGKASVVYIAKNAEGRITSPVVQLCQDKGVRTVFVDDMAELGRACGIKVGAAMAAILKED